MNSRRIIEVFDEWRRDGKSVALATVYETLGSTYSKAGHRILISADGDYHGLISGGCLEGDLAEHAQRVLESESAQPITYDLRDEVDDVFGLGVGCNGLIRVFMQPLFARNDYKPFAQLRDLYEGARPRLCATIIDAPEGGLEPGSTFLLAHNNGWSALSGSSQLERYIELLDAHGIRPLTAAEPARFDRIGEHGVLFAPIQPIPRILILGAGLDAVPLVRMAAELGWYVDVMDHRPAYLARDGLAVADCAELVDPRKILSVDLQERHYDAAIVMSHHLESDALYLRGLAPLDLRYLGVLGPPARREKLLESLEVTFPDLRRRLRGPIGLDIGGGGPEAIALSILAELQSVFAGRA